MNRLPRLPATTTQGHVYVVRSGTAYKIGFTRNGLRRRVRNAQGELVLSLSVGQSASQLEAMMHKRFAPKLLPSHCDNSGGKREWFALDDTDIEWLKGLAESLR